MREYNAEDIQGIVYDKDRGVFVQVLTHVGDVVKVDVGCVCRCEVSSHKDIFFTGYHGNLEYLSGSINTIHHRKNTRVLSLYSVMNKYDIKSMTIMLTLSSGERWVMLLSRGDIILNPIQFDVPDNEDIVGVTILEMAHGNIIFTDRDTIYRLFEDGSVVRFYDGAEKCMLTEYYELVGVRLKLEYVKFNPKDIKVDCNN